ncbi:type I methionyl aminopeptidase [Christensenellaceae bacterium 44-20]
MIIIKSAKEIEKMRQAGRVAAQAMEKVLAAVRPGVTTGELDRIAFDYIIGAGATPSFKGYGGFPGSICASVNEQVVHGIPGHRRLREGDIISIDMGAYLHGFHSDMARTVGVGQISPEAQRLIDITKESFYRGIAQAIAGNRIFHISKAIEEYAVENGVSVVRELIGHGVGQDLHEAPDVPNFVSRFKGPVLRPGMTIAVEPMLNLGTPKVAEADDGWTVSTLDGKLSAHYENTIAIMPEGPCEILTAAE